MKSRAFVAVIMLALLRILVAVPQAQAQYSDYYYHRVDDTVEWRSEIGYYDWWEFEEWYNEHLDIGINKWTFTDLYYSDSSEMLQRFYTPMPLKIIGIAGCFVRGRRYISFRMPNSPLIDTDYYKEYLRIYDATPDSFPLVANVEWNPFDPHRMIHVGFNVQPTPIHDSCCVVHPLTPYLRLYEYYFDSAIYVTDSFYVGGTDFGTRRTPDSDSLETTYWVATTFPHGAVCNPDLQTSSGVTCLIPNICNKIKGGSSFANAQWKWVYNNGQSAMIYPIIEVDTTRPPADACDPLGNVAVTVEGTTATVTWDDFPNYTEIHLRYGSYGHPQSTWTEMTLPAGTTHHTLSGLQPYGRYEVTLQALCAKTATPWCQPIQFLAGIDTNGGQGGQGTEGTEETLLSQLTFVQPNPAKDEVRVTSSFGLKEVELWTADGVMVYHSKASGHEMTVDISGMRSGTYIVAIHTHNGTTHKRLVVTR